MSSVAEIEKAIAKLALKEFMELEAWFDEERARIWDRELETDSNSGALDGLIKEVQDDIASGNH